MVPRFGMSEVIDCNVPESCKADDDRTFRNTVVLHRKIAAVFCMQNYIVVRGLL